MIVSEGRPCVKESAADKLDAAVRAVYVMRTKYYIIMFLLALNTDLADREATMKPVIGPGLPPVVKDPAQFITTDCITVNASGV